MTVRTFLDGRVTLHCGDCMDVLAAMPDASIDSVVSDPPYALVSIVKRFGSDTAAAAKSDGATGVYGRASAGFMGKKWDTGEVAFAPAFWVEVLRVLKPGGHVIAFSGTRTYHRLACAIEDAGFEIRDQIQWVYGSGFPKSHDVSKAIDKAGGLSPREQSTLLRKRREQAGLSREQVAKKVGCTLASVRDWEDGRARAVGRALEWITPSDEYREKLASLLGYSADERELIGLSLDRRGDGSVIGLGHSGQVRLGGSTQASREWHGWGSALKPACEPICLARKPLIGTIAENVLTHGTGAINIDGCRVEATSRPWREARRNEVSDDERNAYGKGLAGSKAIAPTDVGRFPANLIHDGSDEVLACFPDAPGQLANASASTEPRRTQNIYGAMTRGNGRSGEASADRRYADEGATNFAALPGARRDDSGSAARFFYSSKADADDRLGSKHPTVKPVDLMQYLVRLVTRKGGTVLDPFAGTGTTGEAAWREGMNAVLIEREPEYQEDIARRMELAVNPTKRTAVAKTKNKFDDPNSLPLFAQPEDTETC